MFTVRATWTDEKGEAQTRYSRLAENDHGMTCHRIAARGLEAAEWMPRGVAERHAARARRKAARGVTIEVVAR